MRSTVLLALAPLTFFTFAGAAQAAPTERVTFYCQSGGAACCPNVMSTYVRGGPITLVKRGAAVYRDGLISCGSGGALRVRG